MSKKILLADDSITIQKVIGITFANEDYELTVVDNGADAVIKAGEINPDLVLADVIMPEKDGYEVCKEIKAIPALAGTPVILLTGTFEAFDEAKSKEVGADDYITKPFESQTLIDKVKEQLAKVVAVPSAAAAVTPVAAPPAAPVPAAPVIETAPPATAPAAADDIVFDLGEDEVVAAPAAPAPVAAAPEEDMWAEDEFSDVAPTSVEAVETTAVVEEPASDEDIWGDMDLGEEPEAEADIELETVTEEKVALEEEFDEFEFEDEIPGVEDFMKEPATAPVEEESIEFEDELNETPSVVIPPVEAAPVVEAPVPAAPQPEAQPVAEPVSAPAAASQALPEEQLRTLLSQVSKEVIEKVVWEVVPELAETLIKEEIKKLKAASD